MKVHSFTTFETNKLKIRVLSTQLKLVGVFSRQENYTDEMSIR